MRKNSRHLGYKHHTIRHEKTFREEKRNGRQALFRLLSLSTVYWLFVWLALFLFLQIRGCYHFFYLDQEHLFVYDTSFFLSLMEKPAGLVEYLNAYLTQFFVFPYCGAFIMSVLLTATCMLTAAVIKRIAPHANLFICSLLPAVTCLFTMFDFNYCYSGIIAYLLTLAALYFYFSARSAGCRIAYALTVSMLLFWLAGAVAFLFIVCVFFRELLNRFTQAYGFLLPLLLIVGLAIWGVMSSWAGDYRFLILPDGYYTRRLQPGIVLYFSWICLPVLLLLAFLLRNKPQVKPGRRFVEILVQLALVCGIFVYGMKNYVNLKAEFFKELDYYVRMEQWDKVMERCHGSLTNYLYKCYLNMALAEKGELGDRMFAFDQSGLRGLVLPKNRVTHISVILSDIYFSMGHVALSQQMAFEANVSTPGAGNPRMYKRLIQTNLILGAYPVAEKYIALLEKTRYYKSWATAQRHFLWNDEAVEADPVLGMKRRCLPAENTFAEIRGLDFDLKQIAKQNPAHATTVQYAGAMYLLGKNMLGFKDFIETMYGTEALPVLPKSFQEAVIIFTEQDPDYWERFNVSESIIRRYTEFRQQVLANRQNPSALPNLLHRSFGDTYWYYFMLKKAD
ncbi:MAG: DUF6057 family protein [Tannerella sp.]|jgi:hypothetical protein|nr:DUF6057 family protein [Tannerella sp.]